MAASTSEDGLGGGPDTGSSLMYLVSPEPEGVFVQVSHPKWVKPTSASMCQSFLFLCSLLLLSVAVVLGRDLESSAPGLQMVIISGSLLCIAVRTVVYLLIGWTWYLFDYCIVVNFSLVALFCSPRDSFSPLSSAVLFVAAFTLPGFNMVLKGKLLLHHWEAFSAFWLHVGVGWVCYFLQKWYEQEQLPEPDFGIAALLAAFSSRVYCPWALGYLVLTILREPVHLPCGLSKQPYLCQDIVAQVKGRSPPTTVDKITFIVCHAVVAHAFAVIACLAFFHPRVKLAWLLVSTASSVWNGAVFYRKCIDKCAGD